MGRILIVDDDPASRDGLLEILENHDCTAVSDGKRAVTRYKTETFDLVLLDVMMPGLSGLQVLEILKKIDPIPPVIMITALDRSAEAVQAMKLGAIDYIIKPFGPEILSLCEQILDRYPRSADPAYSRQSLDDIEIIYKSAQMDAIMRDVENVASQPSTVLITGESGTGKELVAKVIHQRSGRARRPFVDINCAAIPENLFESELFGHSKGAFTGASADHMGKFEYANGGTLFLDEISLMPKAMQAKLLRVLQEKHVTKVGSHRRIKVDVRVIAATNQDLPELMMRGRFREDLYYRLNVIPLMIPPLRERIADIALLVRHFIKVKTAVLGKRFKLEICQDAIKKLETYAWPGNVRELEHVIERTVALAQPGTRTITPADLPMDLLLSNITMTGGAGGLKEATKEFERRYITQALKTYGWNQSLTAKSMGVHRNTLLNKINDLGIQSRS